MEEKDVELVVRRVVSEEVGEHRRYISELSKYTVIAAFSVLALLAASLTFWYGNKLDDLEEGMIDDAKASFENKIKSSEAKFDSTVKEVIESEVAKLDIEQIIDSEFDQKTRKKLVSEIISSLDDEKFFNELNAKYKDFELLSKSFDGAVIGFASEKCPAGWRPFTPAYGRFLRGTDLSGRQIDPDGKRVSTLLEPSLQEDEFKVHDHGGKYSVLFPKGVGGPDHANLMARGGVTHQDFSFNPAGGEETRPKNVAVLFCIRS